VIKATQYRVVLFKGLCETKCPKLAKSRDSAVLSEIYLFLHIGILYVGNKKLSPDWIKYILLKIYLENKIGQNLKWGFLGGVKGIFER